MQEVNTSIFRNVSLLKAHVPGQNLHRTPNVTQALSSLTPGQLEERFKKLDSDVATIDFQLVAVKKEVLIKEVMKSDDA